MNESTNPQTAPTIETVKPVSDVSAQILGKHQARRKRKNKLDKTSEVQNENLDKSIADSPSAPAIDREMVERALKSICETVDGVFSRKVYKVALLVTSDKSLAKELADDAGMKVPEMELITSLGAAVMEKHSILGNYAPEVLLGVTLCGYSVRMTLAISKLNSLLAEQNKIKGVDATKPQTVQNTDKR